MATLSQATRHHRVKWFSGNHWFRFPWTTGENTGIVVKASEKYIRFAWFSSTTSLEPFGLGYTLDRARWEAADAQARLWMIEEETCWCARKVGDKFARIRECIEAAMLPLA